MKKLEKSFIVICQTFQTKYLPESQKDQEENRTSLLLILFGVIE